jgi:hypothetical protein
MTGVEVLEWQAISEVSKALFAVVRGAMPFWCVDLWRQVDAKVYESC